MRSIVSRQRLTVSVRWMNRTKTFPVENMESSKAYKLTSTSTPSRNPQTHTTHGEEENIFRSRRLDSGFTKDVGFSRHGERVIPDHPSRPIESLRLTLNSQNLAILKFSKLLNVAIPAFYVLVRFRFARHLRWRVLGNREMFEKKGSYLLRLALFSRSIATRRRIALVEQALSRRGLRMRAVRSMRFHTIGRRLPFADQSRVHRYHR